MTISPRTISPKGQREFGLPLIAFLVLFAFNARAAAPATTINICDRTPQVEEAILAKIPAPKPSCSAVPAASLSAIERLNLREKGSTSLLAGDFDNLTGLEGLILAGNALTSLPSGIFDNLTALEMLNLNGNQLATLPPGIFDNLPKLDALLASNNRLLGIDSAHALFARVRGFGLGLLAISIQSAPAAPPPCQPAGGFPAKGDAECLSAPETASAAQP